MSGLSELVIGILQTQVNTCAEDGGICPATAFNAVAAAFATQGYFMQADMLYYLVGTGFGIWAPMIYMIAAAGGIISLAMGMPPRMYVWFFVGPGIYHWLVETRAPAHGVQWQVGGIMQDQRSVWRLAHVGLLNSSLAARMEGEIPNAAQDTRYELGSNVQQSAWCKRPTDPVYVSNFFLWFDDIISYTVQRLVNITGITRTAQTSSGSGQGKGVLDYDSSGATSTNNWYLMSDKKWVLLDTITSARLNNSDLRDAFATFLSSECGDQLSLAVDHTNFVMAANSASGLMPCTVIRHTDLYDRSAAEECTGSSPSFAQDNYTLLWDVLRPVTTPIPEGLRRIFQDDSMGSFVYFLNGLGGSTGDQLKAYYRVQDVTECHQTFYTIMQGFRWEAAQVYNQLVGSGPVGIDDQNLLYNLFYGWGIRQTVGGDLVEAEDMKDWVRNLIFVHLIRNELAVAPRVADKKFSNEVSLQTYAQNYVAQTGSKTKYGEVYSWARMVPYVQGVLLYLLAMGYPFACIMIVMPGWHKTLFTWMSFWVWVKMWDAGFAVVSVIERSIWSMLGNSTKMNYTSPLVNQMTDWGKTTFTETCSASGLANALNKECFADLKLSLTCAAVPDFKADASAGGPWWHAAALFDRALMLGSTIDIDVANGYYIYLMSALYFAVPAATGQLILGAKAGVAGMANSLMQGGQQDAGRGSSSGFTGDIKNKASQTAAAVGQAAAAKGYKASGFAARSLDASNQQLDYGLQGQLLSAANQNLGLRSSNQGLTASTANAFSGAASALANYGAAHAQNPAGNIYGDNFGKNFSPFLDPKGLYSAFQKDGGLTARGETGAANPNGAETTGGKVGQLIGGKGLSLAGQGLSQWYQLQSAAAQMGTAGYNADITAGSNASQAAMNNAQAFNNVGSFAANTMGAALGTTERRAGAMADFGAQSAGYYARRGLADNAAAYTNSLGVDTMHLAVGNKPADMMGMAGSGMLGGGMRSAFSYSSQGFMASRGAAMGQLWGGAAAVQSQYRGGDYSIQGAAVGSNRALQDVSAASGISHNQYSVDRLGTSFNNRTR